MNTQSVLTVPSDGGGVGDPPPFVTVIVPCRNERQHIAQCLDSIVANGYPDDRMEILVLDGMSDDGTRAIVAAHAAKHPCIRMIDNPQKHIPSAMNIGIRAARGERVLKMDAHSTYRPEYISRCVQYQDQFNAENAGGIWRMVPGADSLVARAIVLALAHRFGSGNANVKTGVDKPTWSDSTAFGCFRRSLFDRIGMYDENLLSSSDLDLNQRIRSAGGGILVAPDIVIDYRADATLRSFRKHVFADGVWVSYVLKFGKAAFSWRHWVPAAFLFFLSVCVAGGVVYRPLLWLAAGTAGLYAAVALFFSAQISTLERDPRLFFLLPAVFGVRHFVHGFGTLFGLVLVAVPGKHWKGRRARKG